MLDVSDIELDGFYVIRVHGKRWKERWHMLPLWDPKYLQWSLVPSSDERANITCTTVWEGKMVLKLNDTLQALNRHAEASIDPTRFSIEILPLD